MSLLIKENETVLFQGDSITDCSRNKDDGMDLGNGYAGMAASLFTAAYPMHNVRFINRGIAGHSVLDLRDRWTDDCISLKPDWISILIGINDCYIGYCNKDSIADTVQKYENGYRDILTQIKDNLSAKLVIMEPFLLLSIKDRISWRAYLDPIIHVTRAFANEFKAIYIPLDGLFVQTSTQTGPLFWSEDGVHPKQAGHALMAQAWLKAVGCV